MKIFFTTLALAVLILPALSMAADDASVIKLDFENFSLESLPSGWKKEQAANLSLIQDPKHGMVLKVANKTGQTSGLLYTLNQSKFAGTILDVKADVKLLADYRPGDKFFQLPKIQGKWKNAEGKNKYLTIKIENGSHDWKSIQGRMIIPEKATNISIGLVIEEAGAEVLYDNFFVEIVPASKPFKADPVAPAPPTPPTAPSKQPEAPKEPVKLDVPGLGEKKADAPEKKEAVKSEPKSKMRTDEAE